MPGPRAVFLAIALAGAGAWAGACSSFDDAPDADADADAGAGDASTPSIDGGGDAASVDGGAEASRADTYRAAILGDGPIAYWRMGRVENTVVIPDETAGGHDLTLSEQGVTTGAAGAVAGDPAVSFDGQYGFASAPSSTPIGFVNKAPFTVELWASKNSTGGAGETYQHLFSFVDGHTTPAPSTQTGYLLYLYPAVSTTFAGYGSGDAGAMQIAGNYIEAGTWAHYAVTFDGAILRLYVDGAPQETMQVNGAFGSHVSPFTIARASSETARYYKGSIDEVAVYGKVLESPDFAKRIAIARNP